MRSLAIDSNQVLGASFSPNQLIEIKPKGTSEWQAADLLPHIQKENIMFGNVGTTDRAARVILGLGLIAFAWFFPQVSYSYLGWIGIVPLLTGAFGTCPLYALLGINTCKPI